MATTLPTPEGRLLRAWRAKRGLSQDALGAAVKKGGDKGMDGSLIGHYERGSNRPSVDQLLDIVIALRVGGDSEEEMLARFFAGPDSDLLTAAEAKIARAEILSAYQNLQRFIPPTKGE